MTVQQAFKDTLERRPDERAVGFADIHGNIDWLTTTAFHRESAARAASSAGGAGSGGRDSGSTVFARSTRRGTRSSASVFAKARRSAS